MHLRRLSCAFLLIALVACGDELGPNISGVDPLAIARVEVEPRLDTVYVGDTVAAADPLPYEAVAIGRSGSPLSLLFVWLTSAPEVAAVDDRGVARPVGVGTTQIIASAGKQGEATLVVLREVAAVSIAPVAPVGAVGEELPLVGVATAPDGEPVRGVAFTWSSSDATVATVDEAGVARLLAPGTATITVTGGGQSAQATLVVVAAAP